MGLGWPRVDTPLRRCRTCEVGERTPSRSCWSCHGPTEDGDVIDLLGYTPRLVAPTCTYVLDPAFLNDDITRYGEVAPGPPSAAGW